MYTNSEKKKSYTDTRTHTKKKKLEERMSN